MPSDQKDSHVVVIGGGMAGLAAASTLASRGVAVTLLEAASQLGGRARSVAIEYNSQIIQLDNGQHILLGAYSETLKLLASIGLQEKEAFLRMPLNLDIRNGSQTAFKLVTPAFLPAPFDQLISFLLCKGLSWGERLSVIKFMIQLKKRQFQLSANTFTADTPLQVFLQKNNQSENTIQLLWEPLCLAALNTPIHTASSKVFLNVLRDTFANKHSANFLLAKHDLSQVFAVPIARYLKKNNVKIQLNQRVKNIKIKKDGYIVATKNAEIEASHVIIALSPAHLVDVVSVLPNLDASTKQAESFSYQPIYTVYLQYASHATLGAPMLGLSNTLTQWVFDRGILCGQSGLMAVIISAKGKHQQYTQDALALRVAQELRNAFPHLVKPLWHKVIAEKRATFSCEVNLPRPANLTSYAGLYLAGDYTYADYPATIEGAVRSGVACADLVCNTKRVI